jgi:diaminopimelate epimerase
MGRGRNVATEAGVLPALHRERIAGRKMTFQTLAGVMKAEIRENHVELQLTSPVDVKLIMPSASKTMSCLSAASWVFPQILLTDDVERAPVEELGRAVRYHKAFSPQGTNVDL